MLIVVGVFLYLSQTYLLRQGLSINIVFTYLSSLVATDTMEFACLACIPPQSSSYKFAMPTLLFYVDAARHSNSGLCSWGADT